LPARSCGISWSRRRNAQKRGGEDKSVFVATDVDELHISSDPDMLALDAALTELERLNQRQADIVECRFFGGFSEPEAAATLGISLSTLNRDWRAAKAWLRVQMRRTA